MSIVDAAIYGNDAAAFPIRKKIVYGVGREFSI
jgi:hypothetical protein